MSLTVAALLLTQVSALLGADQLPVKLPATSEAVLGGTALLNCTYPPTADLILYWTRLGPGSERPVYTYYRGEALPRHADPAYQGRATVPPGQPRQGDGALQLHNVTLADEGRYRCRAKSERGMGVAETELRLISRYRLSWLQPHPCSSALRTVTLTCLAEGGYPLATITIRDSSGRGYGAKLLVGKDSQGLYNTSLRAEVPCSLAASYACTLNTTLHQQNRTWTLLMEEHSLQPQPPQQSWPRVGVGVGVGMAMAVLLSGALWAKHKRKQGQSHEGPHPPWEADPGQAQALWRTPLPDHQRPHLPQGAESFL